MCSFEDIKGEGIYMIDLSLLYICFFVFILIFMLYEIKIPKGIDNALRKVGIGDIKCNNDSLTINGVNMIYTVDGEVNFRKLSTVLPKFTKSSTALIPNSVKNGSYSYEPVASYKDMESATAPLVKKTLPSIGINVHSPVVTNPSFVTSVREKDGGYVLESGETYTLKFNSYAHLSNVGYGTGMFDAYTYARIVKFPVNMYIDNVLVNANTLRVVGNTFTIRIPDNVDYEGALSATFYSVANNYASLGKTLTNTVSSSQAYANKTASYYSASAQIKLFLDTKRIYDFNVYDINDYPLWEPIFRKPNSVVHNGTSYRAGIYDYNKNKVVSNATLTLPILNGSHLTAKNKGTVKLGYAFRYNVKTQGSLTGDKDYLLIKPKFYYVRKNGTGRQEVDLYYNETIQGKKEYFIKVGSSKDLLNTHVVYMGNKYVNASTSELTTTASLLGIDTTRFIQTKVNGYTYGEIKIPSGMRTFIGDGSGAANDEEKKKAQKRIQNWYGEYSLPSDTFAVPKNYDIQEAARVQGGLTGKESFWLKDGYIIINFDISAYKHQSATNTYEKYIQYNGDINMWQIEGYGLSKKDSNNSTFSLQYGDIIFYSTLYDGNKKVNADQDYISGGTH